MAITARKTKQKNIISQEIKKFDSFFTGEELYKSIIKNNPKIGIATIYRFLKNLRDKKEIHSYNCNRRIIYSFYKKSHCHFVFEKCKKISHIDIKNIDFIGRLTNTEVCHFQLDIYGICNECKKI